MAAMFRSKMRCPRMKSVKSLFITIMVMTTMLFAVALYRANTGDEEDTFGQPVEKNVFPLDMWDPRHKVGDIIRSKSEDSASSLSEVELAMKKRQDKVTAVCRENREALDTYRNISIVYKPRRFLYCPVPKVASTFWTRFFHQLVYTFPMKSPFDVNVTQVLPKYFYKFRLTEDKGPELKSILQNLTKMIFVRDPYTRIFSAFIDKLMSPNPHLWKKWGVPSIKKFRQNRQWQWRHTCGNDATFSEFVSFVVTEEWKVDVHLEPIFLYCSPCYINFTVIGKMETFQRDANHLISLLNIPNSDIEFDRMEDDVVADAIEDSAKDSLSQAWLSKTLLCITKEDVLRRILRKLQIRGIISWRFQYRLTPSEAEEMTLPKYIELLTESRLTFFNKTELRIQKRQAYLEAYSTLNSDQFEQLKQVYQPDILMFDYVEMQKTFDDISTKLKVNTQALDWTRDWDLSAVL